MLYDSQPIAGRMGLYSLNETAAMIRAGRLLIIAADGKLLNVLPKGEWIGGVCTRFQVASGCVRTEEKAYVMDFTEVVQRYQIGVYPDFAVERVYSDIPRSGFTYLLMPGFSNVNKMFGEQLGVSSKEALPPLAGWVSGADIGEVRMQEPFVIDGQHGVIYTDNSLALHCVVKSNQQARLEVINPFSADTAGDTITFESSTMTLRECEVNGSPCNFADYVREHAIPEHLPLVGEVQRMAKNVALFFPPTKSSVTAASPVLPSIEYHFAQRHGALLDHYEDIAVRGTRRVISSVHSFSNYTMMSSGGRRVGPFTGPFVFGEIARLLLNQTTVNLIVEEIIA